MTTDSKIALGISGFFICFIFGWGAPILWLLFLVLIFVLATTPTKKKLKPAVATQVSKQAIVNDTSASRRIEAMIREEPDEKVKEGLQRALAVIGSSATASPQFSNDSVTFEPQPVLSKAEQDEQRAAQELRNVNVILYTASFLLVGAAAAFIAVSEGVAPIAKFTLLLFVAATFYGVGLLVHAQSVRLRPAATAFVGTGLALIPFVGLAGYYYVLPDGPLMWWLTSMIGLAAFLLAISRIRTSVMGYLTLAFVFSMATSTVSVLHAPFIWYFVSVIVTGSVLTYISFKRPRALPESFIVPLEQNAQLAVPVALIGAVLAVNELNAWDYTILSGVATLHYLVNSLGFATDKTRAPYWSVARALLIVFAATLAYAISSDWKVVGMVLAVAAVGAHVYSIRKIGSIYEQAWLWVAQGLLVAAVTAWLDSMAVVSGLLIVLAIISADQLRVMKRTEYALAGIAAVLALPLVLFRGVIEPPIGFEYIAILLVVVAAGCIGLRAALQQRHVSFRSAASIGYATLLAEAAVVSVVSLEGAWIAATLIAISFLLYAASYVERQPAIAAISNSILVCGTILAYMQLLDSFTWVPFATSVTLGTVWYATRWLLVSPKFVSQSNVVHADIQMVSSIVIILAGALIVMFQSMDTVVAGALLGLAGAGMLAYEGKSRGARFMYEIALFVFTFSLQRLFGYVYPDAHPLIYTHWWALTGAATILLYVGRTGDWAGARNRAVLSLCMLSLPTGLYALSNPDSYQLLFLIEHVMLAAAGLLLNKRLLVMWGSIGIGLAVLWLLKGYTYVLLALIALGLICLAIWRLMKRQ